MGQLTKNEIFALAVQRYSDTVELVIDRGHSPHTRMSGPDYCSLWPKAEKSSAGRSTVTQSIT